LTPSVRRHERWGENPRWPACEREDTPESIGAAPLKTSTNIQGNGVIKITGNNTDETFIAQDGVSYNGQGGVDTLVFTGAYEDYDIALSNTGNIKAEVSWEDGSLDTKWIEQFVFSDGVYNVATD
jgi:hypothetical protein